jgi:hypothetical protein
MDSWNTWGEWIDHVFKERRDNHWPLPRFYITHTHLLLFIYPPSFLFQCLWFSYGFFCNSQAVTQKKEVGGHISRLDEPHIAWSRGFAQAWWTWPTMKLEDGKLLTSHLIIKFFIKSPLTACNFWLINDQPVNDWAQVPDAYIYLACHFLTPTSVWL